MKSKCVTTLTAMVSLTLCLQSSNTCAQTAGGISYSYDYVHTLGLGFQYGAPIGITAKYWLTDMFAVDGAAGASPYDHSPFEFHADFLVHDFDIFTLDSGKLPVYVGGGLLARFRNDHHDNMVGFRFPLGVSYMFEDLPFDIYAEVAPEFIFTPFRRGYIDGAIGIRFWF